MDIFLLVVNESMSKFYTLGILWAAGVWRAAEARASTSGSDLTEQAALPRVL